MEKGVPIRSLSRGIAVLQAINRGGSLTMTEIARSSRVPYPTACRIVQTLLLDGFIEQEPARKRYRPAPLVQTLSQGFKDDARLIRAARPTLVDLTDRLGWPVALATPCGSSMMIRDSTHAITSLTFSQYYPGDMFPLLECASGLVFLAFAEPVRRQQLLQSARLAPDAVAGLMLKRIEEDRLLEEIRAQGFAGRCNNRFTRDPGKTSSLAVPIEAETGVVAALTLSFFTKAMSMTAAIDSFVEPLQRAARQVGRALTRPASGVLPDDRA